MPVTLVVRRVAGASASNEAELPPLVFDAPRVVLGRGDACDLRLPDTSVSTRHASIRASNAGYVIVDEGSTNGTRLNGERLTPQSPRTLRSGDELTLGRMMLTVRIGAAVPTGPQATRELAMALVARQMGEGASVKVVVVGGVDTGATLELAAGTPRTVGRDPRCSLRLGDRGVPPISLEITLEGARTKVTRRDARVPATLDGKPVEVGTQLTWADRGRIELASTILELDDPLARALDASAEGVDEKVAPPAPPPEPPPAAPAPEVPSPPSAAAVVDAQLPGARTGLVRGPMVERRKNWRGATIAFEVVALILGIAVLAGSVAGLWWLLRR